MLTSKDIITDRNKKIRQKSTEISLPLSEQDKTLANSLLEYVINSTKEEMLEENDLKPAVGIAAIQVGVPKKILAIAYDELVDEEKKEIRYLLANARIISHSMRKTYLSGGEGCLSVEENKEGYTIRAHKIKVKAYDILAEEDVLIVAEGYLAVVLQHEIDHFQGILFYDHFNPINPFFVPDNCVEI